MTRARVFLRHPTEVDAEAFLQMVAASRALHQPWVHAPDTAEAFVRYLQKGMDGRNESFLVCLQDESAIVGVINLNEIIRGALDGAFVGFYAAAGYTGHGYMTEGLTLVLNYAFQTLKLHRLEANIQPANARSIALAKRCGFRLEGFSPRYLRIGGHWCDHERWAITEEDWLGSQVPSD